jgi:hypothetical protein
LENIDRRIIYVLVALSLSLPLVFKWSLKPAPMKAAEELYAEVDKLQPAKDKIVLIAMDWGPGTQAENQPQTAVIIEHLMRKRIPFALVTLYNLGAPFLKEVPEQVAASLAAESPGQHWVYGQDWVNFGYQPQGFQFIQRLAKSSDIHDVLKSDALGTSVQDIELMKNIHTISNIALFAEFTGLVDVFETWIQFFQSSSYRPVFVHGCTSITIPKAYIYFSSKQILGLLEGAAGAAWYEELLSRRYTQHKTGTALQMNTSLAVAQILIIVLMLLGNIGYLKRRVSGTTGGRP